MTIVYTLIGDLVGSRRLPSRSRTHEALAEALIKTSELVPPLDRLEMTVGDEFQGVYGTFADASLAALMVRLNLNWLDNGTEIRCGLGAGEREVLDGGRTPIVQDGPAWWTARAAIDSLDAQAARRRRTWYDNSSGDETGPPVRLANAFLLARDALVDRLNARSRHMLTMSLSGMNQRVIAETLQVSQSAVSQAFAKGVSAVRDAQAMLSDPKSMSR